MAGRIPAIMYFTAVELWNSFKDFATAKTIKKEGKPTPTVATNAPRKALSRLWGHILLPTKVAALITIGPGVICEIVTIWAYSARLNQLRETISF